MNEKITPVYAGLDIAKASLQLHFQNKSYDLPNAAAGHAQMIKRLATFEAGHLPLTDWHHQQHIKVAYLYLCRYPFDVAMTRIRDRIRAHNAVHHLPDLPTSGYHETMTQAWLRLVHVTLCEYGPAESADSFYELNPQLSQKKVLRLFYSREVFMSPRAKFEFVEPDLAPFPRGHKMFHPIAPE
jgi:hypothetical protein